MRRFLLGLLFVMFFVGRAVAGDHTYVIGAGTTDYGLKLPGYTYCQAVYAWDADIGIEFVKDGVEVDSVGLARGTAGQFTVHCDSINVVRTLSTKVTVLLGYPNGPCPSFAGSDAAKYLSDPIPVETSWQDMFVDLSMVGGATTSASTFCTSRRTYPITAGMPLDGAKRILLEFSWTKWVHGGFAFQPIYSASATDTGAMCYSTTWADSIEMDDSLGVADGFVPVVANGTATVLLNVQPGAGYLYIRAWPHARITADNAVHIHSITLRARKVE